MRRCKVQQGFSFKSHKRMDANISRPFLSKDCKLRLQNSIYCKSASPETFWHRELISYRVCLAFCAGWKPPEKTAIFNGLCIREMQTGKTLGLSKRKKECSQNCLFSFAFTQTHEKYKYENSRRHGEKSKPGHWAAALVWQKKHV